MLTNNETQALTPEQQLQALYDRMTCKGMSPTDIIQECQFQTKGLSAAILGLTVDRDCDEGAVVGVQQILYGIEDRLELLYIRLHKEKN